MTFWKRDLRQIVSDSGRSIILGVVLLDILMTAVFSLWFLALALWKLRKYLLQTLFSDM